MYIMQAKTAKATLAIVPELINCLEQGQLVILPMATVYGVVCHANKPQAIANLRKLKNFSQDQPLAILTRGDRAIEVAILKPSAQQMMAHLPLAITMIVEAQPHLNPAINLGFKEIFVICPDQFIYDLVGAIPFPLACATAKIGTELIVSFNEAVRYFSETVAMIVDGGNSLHGRRGTLIDFTLEVPTIMSFGPIAVDELRLLLPEITLPSHLMK